MAGKGAQLAGRPNPRQEEFFLSTARHTAYGGARGGGKSWAMRRKFVLLAVKYPGLKLLLLRRTLPELTENHVRPLCEELIGSGIAKYREAQRAFLFPNGSIIKLGYCDAEKDVYQYQGQEYDVIGLEEATHFTESQMMFLTTCNRSVRTDFSPRMYYTCNPGGVGHNWVKRLFIDKRYENSERPEDYNFIPAVIYDNKVLMEAMPDYIRTLENLPKNQRRAHLYGDWDVVEGQYFEEFDRNKHVVKPFAIPAEWRKFRAMDWGYNDPCCVLWFAVAPDRRIYCYREIYQDQTIASDMAKLIKQETGVERISYTTASPDMWAKRGMTDVMGGESVADVFNGLGVPVIKADNSRIVGWQRVRENLATASDGLPYVQIFETCYNLIRTFPIADYDPHDHEDVSSTCEDHALEAFRYGLMSHPSPAKTEKDRKARVLAFDPFSETKRRRAGGGYYDL